MRNDLVYVMSNEILTEVVVLEEKVLGEKRSAAFYDRAMTYLHSEYTDRLVVTVVCFFSGMIGARGLVFGKYAPFGVAMAASVPRKGMWGALFGALLGYLIPSPVTVSARYTAALIAVTAIRWSLSELKGVTSHGLFAPLATFLPLLLTGVVMVVLGGAVEFVAALYVAEAFLAAGSAFFLSRAAGILTNRRQEGAFDSLDAASLMVALCIMVLSLSGIVIQGVSVGRIVTVIVVLYAARMGGIGGGAIAGTVAGAIQGLSLVGLSYLSGAYGLGGLMAGVFAPMGKIAAAVAFILAHGIASLQTGANETAVIGTIEVAAATIMYMLLPKSRWIEELFTTRKDTLSGSALRDNVVMRLRHASEALSNVYESVDEVSKKLATISAPDMQGVYNNSTERVCTGCARSGMCWGAWKTDTLHNFASLTRPLKEQGRMREGDFQKNFLERCNRTGEMREEINRNYGRFLAYQAAQIRSAQIREVAEAHFHTTSDVLKEMAEEFTRYQHFDDEAARRIGDVMRAYGMNPMEICCRVDRFDRMTIEAEVEKKRRSRINKANFTKDISTACGRRFSPPCVTNTEETCMIQMCQRPRYDILRGFSQYNANQSSFCGDCAAVFYDGQGRLIAMISDGMGTGGHAAVDGAMTVAMAEKLLKSGIGYDSMLQTINSALMAKSGDETLSTVDLVSIDLFTGITEFRKAGAAGTVVKRGKKTEYIELSSMPAGILSEISFAQCQRELESGDMIVMVSDGVIGSGTAWLVDLVDHVGEDVDPNALAERIIDEAKRLRVDGHEDDVSALVLMMA